ncbi:unnamed protein product, partial [Prorocentrum cordatum]
PMLNPRIRKMLPITPAKLRRGAAERQIVKWKDVRGPIAAVQATLLQIGWGPQSPDAWLFPAFGDEQFATAVASHFEDVLGAFMGDCVQLQRMEAARYVAGEDLAAGAGVKTVQMELSRLAPQSKFYEWAADVAVTSGGQWTRGRQALAGLAAQPALRLRGVPSKDLTVP